MAETQPETPISNNIYIALDIVGQTQLAHVGGYRDKLRLGVAMGHCGHNVRIGAMKHYVAERHRVKVSIRPLDAPLRAMKYDELTSKSKGGRNFRGHTYIVDRFGKDIVRGRKNIKPLIYPQIS